MTTKFRQDKRTETEHCILASIAAGDPWKHRNAVIHESGRSYTTVLKKLKELRYDGLIENKLGPTWAYEEWWRITLAGRARLEENHEQA